MLICMIDMSEGGVCLFIHNEREVYFGEIVGMSDGNDLIEEE